MPVSETVQTALITFASGAVGAIAGVIGMIISSKYNSSTQMKQIVIQEYFKQRTEAFSSFLITCERMEIDPFSDENINAYLEAKQCASLVASQAAYKAILNYDNTHIGNHTDEERCIATSELISALQNDLLVYSEPCVKKHKS